jgi:hypothetical protein
MAPSSTFLFWAYNLCSFQPILKSESILEVFKDDPMPTNPISAIAAIQ